MAKYPLIIIGTLTITMFIISATHLLPADITLIYGALSIICTIAAVNATLNEAETHDKSPLC